MVVGSSPTVSSSFRPRHSSTRLWLGRGGQEPSLTSGSRVGDVEVVDPLTVLDEVAGAFDRPAVLRERGFEALIEIVRAGRVAPPLPDAVPEAHVEQARDRARVEVVRHEVALGIFVGGHDQDDALRKHWVLGDRALEDHLLAAEPLQRHLASHLLLEVPRRVNHLAPATDQRLEIPDVRHRLEPIDADLASSGASPSRAPPEQGGGGEVTVGGAGRVRVDRQHEHEPSHRTRSGRRGLPTARPTPRLAEASAEQPEDSVQREREAIGNSSDTGGLTPPDQAQ